MDEDLERILFTSEQIEAKVKEMGRLLSEYYVDKRPLVVCVLKGAAPFMVDLTREMNISVEMDFMDVSSYGHSTVSSGEVKIIKDINTTAAGRHIVIVEDIMDSGLTLKYLVDLFVYRRAASVRVVTLLDKPDRRQVDLIPDWIGFEVPDAFVVGYGLDYAEKYRNLPYIGILRREVYQS